MTVTLTPDEMLAQWMLRRHLLPVRNDSDIAIEYGVDMEALARREMRDWYLKLMAEAPVALTGTEDLASRLAIRIDEDEAGHTTLPDNVVRVVGIETDVWHNPAIIVAPDDPRALMQRGFYSRGGRFSPVAVVDGRHLMLYSFDGYQRASYLRLECVTVPEDGSYRLDESALGLIKPTL